MGSALGTSCRRARAKPSLARPESVLGSRDANLRAEPNSWLSRAGDRSVPQHARAATFSFLPRLPAEKLLLPARIYYGLYISACRVSGPAKVGVDSAHLTGIQRAIS